MSWRERSCSWLFTWVLALTGTGAHAGFYSGMYVFGDSLSDVGNDYIVTGGAVPAVAYYTDGSTIGRFTNGPNYVDRLAAGLGLSVAPSVLGGTGYAYGGARIDSRAAGLPPTALTFNQQVTSYTALGLADPDALYVLWIGANDMSDAIMAAASGSPAAAPGVIGSAVGKVMGSLASAIGGLSGLGARHFLIPNLPDLSLIPEIRSFGSPGLSGLANSASKGFNLALSGTLGAFSALDVRSLDIYGAQTDMTLDPAAYGLTNVSDACYSGGLSGGGTPTVCADPDSYLYWDFEHPTAVLHAEISRLALGVLLPEPENWSLLLAGLGFLGLTARRRPLRR